MASPAAGTAPFLTKTYAIVDDPETDDIISWNDSGTTFVVWRRSEFERDLLPKNFKHSNFASFVRQLNTYGFKKVGVDRWEFANECFRKGEKHLLGGIQRRKGVGRRGAGVGDDTDGDCVTDLAHGDDLRRGSPGSSSSPPRPGSAVSGAVAELEEEISRLRRENARLSRELARARRAFDDVRRVVTRYDHGGEEEDERPSAAGGGKPMLFGVAIGSKRSREDGDEEDGAEEDDGGEDEEEEDDDERHAARREKARRTELSDLNVLALSVRAAAAARPPDVGSRGTKNPSVSLPLGSNRAML